MRFLRYGEPGQERPGVLMDDASFVDIGDLAADIAPASVADGSLEGIRPADLADRPRLDVAGARLGSPLATTGKIVCIGINYAAHGDEVDATRPEEPVIFMKDPACLSGPFDDVRCPPGSQALDYEVELAIVIGRRASYLRDRAQALECVFGYAIGNDLSERDWQFNRGGQWDKGKSFPGFNPFGPYVVTRDEVADPQRLSLELRVNGEIRQSSDTSHMIFDVAHLVWYVSQCMELNPGDVISTGTPDGVGFAMTPPGYLRPGDVLTLQIDGLGRQEYRVIETPRQG